MDEKRRDRRLDLESEIIIKKLDSDVSKETKAKVAIKDVSKSGMGFTCDYQLSIGSVYECSLTIWTKDTIHCFIEIVRMSKVGEGFSYGGIFIGMSEMDSKRIEIYSSFEESGVYDQN